MKRLKVYVDTSVIGGCYDDEFKETSNILFDEFKSGKKIAIISEVTIEELKSAPKRVKEKLKEIPEQFIEKIDITDEIIYLAEKYLEKGIISEKYKADSLHIAAATIVNSDVLVSWNFSHIVNFRKIQQFNGVNLSEGYRPLQIYSPKEVVEFDE